MTDYIKATACIRRRGDVSEDEFHRYWLEDHGELVKSLADSLGATRYVQSHLLRGELTDTLTGSRHAIEPYDGIVEIWFDAADTELTDERLDANLTLLADEATFIDLERSAFFFTVEHVVIDGQVH